MIGCPVFMKALSNYTENHRFTLGASGIQIWGGIRKRDPRDNKRKGQPSGNTNNNNNNQQQGQSDNKKKGGPRARRPRQNGESLANRLADFEQAIGDDDGDDSPGKEDGNNNDRTNDNNNNNSGRGTAKGAVFFEFPRERLTEQGQQEMEETDP